MKFGLLKRNSFFYLILAGFAVMAFVEWPLIINAYKGKDKDFEDRFYIVVPTMEENLVKDTVLMSQMVEDSVVVAYARRVIVRRIDSAFYEHGLPLNYEFAVGKLDNPNGYYKDRSRLITTPNFIWISNEKEREGLARSKFRIGHIGPKNQDVYYIKVFQPSKPSFLLKEMLPLIFICAVSILLLFVCFLILISMLRKQAALALAKEDFVNNMTHELKTPLFTISIASKMLLKQSHNREDEKSVSFIESIQQETKRLSSLVAKVLETSALERQQLKLDTSTVDIHTAVETAIRSFDLISRERGAVITLSLNATHHIVQGDETHIVSALCSLLDNALKYAREEIHISVSTRNESKNILVAIKDNGIGMNLETRKQLFERFFRGHTGDLHNVKGHGIGLSYVKAVVDSHQGNIAVKSTPGLGSEFIITLPYIR